jgi:hypothetical protein
MLNSEEEKALRVLAGKYEFRCFCREPMTIHLGRGCGCLGCNNYYTLDFNGELKMYHAYNREHD